MPSRVAASLAVLTVNADQAGASYLDNFVPIVAETLRISRPSVIALSDLRSAIHRQFGLQIPIEVLSSILERVRRRGFVRRTDQRTLVPDQPTLDTLSFHDTQQRVMQTYERVIDDLRRWCEEHHKLALSETDAQLALDSFLDQYDLRVLTTQDANSAFDVPTSSDRNRYLVARYVQFLQSTSSSLFEFVVLVARGSMLANAMYLPNPGRADKRFRRTQVFLDTSVLLRALGYAEPEREESSRELLDLLYQTGAELCCFSDTLEEMRGILDAARNAVAPGQQWSGMGQTIAYFVSQRYTSSQIAVFMNRLKRDLQSRSVRVMERPDLVPHLSIDHSSLGDCLRGTNGGSAPQAAAGDRGSGRRPTRRGRYRNEAALDHDVNVVQGVMSLRRGVVPRDLEECRAIFVTTNRVLVRCARDVVTSRSAPGVVTPCVTEHAMTTILWLKRPTAAPDLPRKRLIADAFAATQPPDYLWVEYLREVDRLEERGGFTEEDVYLARNSLEARETFMDVTLGDEALVHGSVTQVLDRVKQRLVQESQTLVESLKSEREAAARHRESVARLAARLVSRIVTGLTVVALFLLYGLASFIPFPVPQLARLAGLLAAAAVTVYGISNSEFGVRITSWSRVVELTVARRVKRWLDRLAGYR
jgi:hypothetical protein